MIKRSPHTTADEVSYLKSIGQWWNPRNENGRARRARLLRSYLSSMEGRRDWGAVDPAAVKDFIREALLEDGAV